MGQVFFDLGMLSAVEVIECSASDLIGSYVGQTGPKTRAQLEKALGKVLFVDEAYRLAEGNFATEAINELVDLLTKPTFIDKIVVILAGYDEDIDNLISVNPGLSSRFPEQIVFKNMGPQHCLQILERKIQQQEIETPPMADTQSEIHQEMVQLLTQLAALPSWGNARDIETLAKTMIGSVFRSKASATDALAISSTDVLRYTKVMLNDRKGRAANIRSKSPLSLLQGMSKAPQALPPLLSQETTTSQIKTTMDQPRETEELPPPTPPLQEVGVQRDDGVSDEVWIQLQADIRAAEADTKISEEMIMSQEAAFSAALTQENERIEALKKLEQAKAKDEEEIQELKRKQEEARLRERAARIAREKAMAELERIRLQEVRQKREAQVQTKLQQMGVCCAGFQWIKQSSGYRCAGGSHYVSNGELGL